MGILWIVIIVILVLALLGFLGRGRVFKRTSQGSPRRVASFASRRGE
jgi:flagellar basal body-associated protein FliL